MFGEQQALLFIHLIPVRCNGGSLKDRKTSQNRSEKDEAKYRAVEENLHPTWDPKLYNTVKCAESK